MLRKSSVAIVCAVLVLGFTPSAHAILASGACVFTVTFNFDTRVHSSANQLTHPDYTVSGGNPVPPLSSSCAIPLTALNDPLNDTGMVGFGDSTIWTCEATVAGGTWDQDWEGAIPSIENGAHKIAGSWGAWEMVLWDLSPTAYVGSMTLTVHPDDVTKLSTCQSSGIRSLKMVGIMVFQDP